MSAAASTGIKNLFNTAEPPRLDSKPRAGTSTLASVSEQANTACHQAGLSARQTERVRALALLWHDHHDAAHTIVQDMTDADGSFIHAILHRREPDYWNAKYWWRRVGNHACFPELAKRVTALLDSPTHATLLKQLVPRGQWDACAFVDACEAAADLPPTDGRVQSLREVQQIESEVLLARLLQK